MLTFSIDLSAALVVVQSRYPERRIQHGRAAHGPSSRIIADAIMEALGVPE